MESLKILILDDHTLFLKGMSMILKNYWPQIDVYAYQSIKNLKSDNLKFDTFDLMISDIELPNEDTFGLFSSLRLNFPELPILVVSMHKKQAIIKKCKALNIEGYLLKDEDEQLVKAIKTILGGGIYYSKTIVNFFNNTKSSFEKLSKREEEVIKLIADGFTNIEIAEKLFLSKETIKTHIKNIKLKLEITTRHEITKYAKLNFVL